MLDIIYINNSEKWDKIVKSFTNYDVYYLSGYVKAFQLHGDGEPLLFYFQNGQTRAVNVVMKRDISEDRHFINKIEKGRYYDLSTPYGYGGWLIEGENGANLFNEYKDWCAGNGIVCEFVRFHPVLENHRYAESLYKVISLGSTVTMNLTSPETIWNNITSKNRNIIRKAQKNEVKIYNAWHPALFKIFKDIYDKTMDKNNAKAYYYFSDEFYRSILEELPYNAKIFFAVYEDKIIAASVILMANQKMSYHLSGSLYQYSNLAPTNLIIYHAALWGNENGYKSLYLGGGVGSGKDSLYKFKKAFNKNEDKDFYIGGKIFNQQKYDELMNIRKKYDNNFDMLSEYFPLYRV